MPAPLRPAPERFRVEETNRTLRIAWRWFKPGVAFLVFFAVFWDGFLVVWYANATMAIAHGGHGASAALLFPLLHVAAGVWVTYQALTGLVNRTTIEIVEQGTHTPAGYREAPRATAVGTLVVRHGPIPARGNLTMPIESIRQLFVASRDVSSKGRVRFSYDLMAITQENRSVTVLRNLERGEALYLEAQLEAKLGLPDEEVAGATRS